MNFSLTSILSSALIIFTLLAKGANAASYQPWINDGMDRFGACGSGAVVQTDGCNPVRVTNQSSIHAYGQGLVGGMNTQDTDDSSYWMKGLSGINDIKIVIWDAADVAGRWAKAIVDDVSWTFTNQVSGNVQTIYLKAYDGETLKLRYLTSHNDGATVKGYVCQ